MKWVINFVGLLLLFALVEYKRNTENNRVKSNSTSIEKVKKVPPNYWSGTKPIVKPDQMNFLQPNNEKRCNPTNDELYLTKIHKSDLSEKVTYANTAFQTDWVNQFIQWNSTLNQDAFNTNQCLNNNHNEIKNCIDSYSMPDNESNK